MDYWIQNYSQKEARLESGLRRPSWSSFPSHSESLWYPNSTQSQVLGPSHDNLLDSLPVPLVSDSSCMVLAKQRLDCLLSTLQYPFTLWIHAQHWFSDPAEFHIKSIILTPTDIPSAWHSLPKHKLQFPLITRLSAVVGVNDDEWVAQGVSVTLHHWPLLPISLSRKCQIWVRIHKCLAYHF